MWARDGACAGFPAQQDYFRFALAAAQKYSTDVSAACSSRQMRCGQRMRAWRAAAGSRRAGFRGTRGPHLK